MKKLIRNISVMVALAAVTSTQAQFLSLENQGDFTEMDNDSGLFETNDTPGGSPEFTDDDPQDVDPGAPINDYLPFLLIGAAGLAVYYRKQILAKI